MIKWFVIIILITFNPLCIASQTEYNSYIILNPKIKLGKYENGNYFVDFVPLKANWRINEYFSISGGASVGFTGPRNNFGSFNHYMNRLTIKSTYKPFNTFGIFAEASFSNLIEGHTNDVDYFRTGNYQAIGIDFDILKITGDN